MAARRRPCQRFALRRSGNISGACRGLTNQAAVGASARELSR
jgi:hypothetical protein